MGNELSRKILHPDKDCHSVEKEKSGIKMSELHKLFILKLIWILTGPIIVACQWNTEKEQQKNHHETISTLYPHHNNKSFPSNPSSFISHMMSPGQDEESKSSLSLKGEKWLARSSTLIGWLMKVFELKPENSCQRDKILDKAQSSTFKQAFPHLNGQKRTKRFNSLTYHFPNTIIYNIFLLYY